MTAKDLMTPDPACCLGDTPVPDAARMMSQRDCGQIPVVEGKTRRVVGVQRVMEKHQIRRVPVVNDNGELSGIVSQADIARHRSSREAGELVKGVSEPAR
jgi:CBS domain-containing protein